MKIFRFFKKLGKWLPIIWNQENWDYEFIYDLLEFKMKDLREAISKDKFTDRKRVRRNLRQIDICLKRMDVYLNWPDYYYYPMNDIYTKPLSNGCVQLAYYSEVNEQQRLGAIKFEEDQYKKFWKSFIKWHRNWWI